jgi:hypothetical protein
MITPHTDPRDGAVRHRRRADSPLNDHDHTVSFIRSFTVASSPAPHLGFLSTSQSQPSSIKNKSNHLLHPFCKQTTLIHNTTTSTSSIMRSKFKDEHPFEKRKAEAERIVSTFFRHLSPPQPLHHQHQTDLSVPSSAKSTLTASPSSAKRWKNPTSQPSTRKSILSRLTSPWVSSFMLFASASSLARRRRFSSSSMRSYLLLLR